MAALEGVKPARPPEMSPLAFATAEDGCQLAYRVWRSPGLTAPFGVPLVLVQGWMGVKEDWAGLDRILCKRIRAPVVIFDNRGVGESDVPETSYTMSLFVSDLMAVVSAAIGKTDFDLFGISMGGCIVQMAALASNPLIRRVVVGCSTPGGPETKLGAGLLECFQIMTDPATKNLSPLEQTRNIQYHNLPTSWIEQHPDMFTQFLADTMRYNRPHKGLVSQMKALSKFNVAATVSKINVPALIIHGDEDDMIPIESARLLHDLIADSHMVELKGAAHLFWITHLHDTVRPVAAFLTSPQQQLANSPHLMASATSSTTLRAKL